MIIKDTYMCFFMHDSVYISRNKRLLKNDAENHKLSLKYFFKKKYSYQGKLICNTTKIYREAKLQVTIFVLS